MSLTANPVPTRRIEWMDGAVFLMLAAVLFGIMTVAHQWHQPLHKTVDINLSPWALPKYTLFTLSRGLVAYVFSLLFSIAYGQWAAYDHRAERVLLPLLDILQSIPVLGFLPGLVLALVYLFPSTNLGLELACVLMIFTAQVWNMTFSYYYSLKGIPDDFLAVGRLFGFSPIQRFFQIELPCAANGLVYNSMISMAGGWFFITINEAFTLGKEDFRLPGIGSYMSVAIQNGDHAAQFYAIVAMIVMIVAVDQLLWRPLVVWAQRFKIEDTDSESTESSWWLTLLRRSRIMTFLGHRRETVSIPVPVRPATARPPSRLAPLVPWIPRVVGVAVLCVSAYFGLRLFTLLAQVGAGKWGLIGYSTFLTFLRVLGSIALGSLWAIPVGVWIGLNPRWSRLLQPITQIAASFPAPMIFPIVVGIVIGLHGNLSWGSVLLMLLGSQWYILFNVIAGAGAIPQDLLACTSLLRLGRWERWRNLYFPGIFPSLVTGWITAAGGAWNSSIVAEYVNYQNQPLVTTGLGSLISQATDHGDFPLLAAAVLVMAVVVVAFNRTVWKTLYRIAQNRYKLEA